jgi:hypothetical protein
MSSSSWALSQLPECAAAWARGEINAAHVDRIMRAWNPRTKDALIRDEHILIEQAKTLSFQAFCRAVDHWEQMADPDGTEAPGCCLGRDPVEDLPRARQATGTPVFCAD